MELERSVEAWRAQRYAALRRPMSWLSLVGLDWLAQGVSRVGSDPRNEVTLPSGPALAGTIELRDGVARATGIEGGLAQEGEPVDGLELVSDDEATDEVPLTTLEVGSLRLCLIRRGAERERFAIRTWDTASPALAAFDGIAHWPVAPDWAIRARFEAADPPRAIAVPDVVGDVLDEPEPGVVAFELEGATHRLHALEGGPQGELWLVFGDATNGVETYGGGRFLYISPPDRDGSVTVDFNRAYNPPCVFSPYATCPLPPDGNKLPIRIEAGERAWTPDRYTVRHP